MQNFITMSFVTRKLPCFLKVIEFYFRRVNNLALMMTQYRRVENSIIKQLSKTGMFMKEFTAVKTHRLNSVLLFSQECPKLWGLKWERWLDVISNKQKTLIFLFVKIKYHFLYPALQSNRETKVFSHYLISNSHEILSFKKITICFLFLLL